MEPTTARKLEPAMIASRAEAARAIASLSHADLVRIHHVARLRANGLKSAGWEDLVQEAFERILSGARRWPRDVKFVAFLCQTIRSLASEVRRRDTQASDDAAQTGDHDRMLAVADDRPCAERQVIAQSDLSLILDKFSDDPAVLNLVEGLAAGETTNETLRRSAMAANDYDAARKRLRRFIIRHLEGRGEVQ